MTYGSVCSGIEAVSVAWKPLGFRPAWFAEIDPFCSALLAHHYPHVSNRGDFTRIETDGTAIDILAGGTPCQSFSVAGRRGGLEDARGNLAIEFCRLAGKLRPRWIVWENVPGVLSSNGGRDFGSIVGTLAELGYGCAWRVLDAQFLGVPQRRRRVFVVGHLGDWRRAAAVLLERESLCRDTPARRKTREEVAGTPGGGTGERGRRDNAGGLTFAPETAYALNAKGGVGRMDAQSNETFVTHASPVPVAFSAKDYGADAGPLAPTLRAMPHDRSHANAGGQVAVAFEPRFARNGRGAPDEIVSPLKAESGSTGKGDEATCVAYDVIGSFEQNSMAGRGTLGWSDSGQPLRPVKPQSDHQMIHTSRAVRRLTPRECERLQGMPDDYTLIPYRGKPAADGPRYRAIGNSMAVPVMRWIGRRIRMVDVKGVEVPRKAS